MSQQPMLFYSTRCTHSQSILRTLDAMQKTSLVKLVSLESLAPQQVDSIRSFVKKVPTLYFPDTKDTLVGQAIQSQIAKPVAARQERPAASGGIASQGPPGAAPGGGEPGAWGFGGGGLTESFSSWTSPGQFTEQDQLNQTQLSGGPGGGGQAANLPQNIQQRGGGESEDIKKRLEQLQSQRANEFAPVTRQ